MHEVTMGQQWWRKQSQSVVLVGLSDVSDEVLVSIDESVLFKVLSHRVSRPCWGPSRLQNMENRVKSRGQVGKVVA